LKWRIKTGGKIVVPPVIAGRRIFFLSWNNVLFCLNKKNGHILWWDIIPSRSLYRLEISGTRIVVSSLSSLLVCFDTESGEKVGDFDAGQEVKSNPVWLQPYLIYSLYDELQDKGRLVFLKKVMNVSLKSSLESPQQVGKEISFTVSDTGFYKPKYEFTLKEGEEKKVVQAKSEKNSWLWFPEKEGNYVVGVEVADEKQSKKAEISFVIKKT
jgi:outer membrane protein assembly factor BamB